MATRRSTILLAAVALCALSAGPARAYNAQTRWTSTATNPSTGTWGTPITVTWSLVADGTTLPGATTSGLIASLDAQFGAGPGGADYTLRPWFSIFNNAFSRVSALSGVSYVYEPHDDGVAVSALPNSAPAGMLGVRGDMRIGGRSHAPGENSILASNYLPDLGDMVINTNRYDYLGQVSTGGPDSLPYRRFRNVLMHESMHGLGMGHVISDTHNVLMASALVSTIDGPQLDDILGLHRMYGDAAEKNGGNDTSATAPLLGQLSIAQQLNRGALVDDPVIGPLETDFLSIDGTSDVDYFRFTLADPLAVTLTLTPQGATYGIGPSPGSPAPYNSSARSDLALTLYDSTGSTLVGAPANGNGIGMAESMLRELNPGTYFARVSGANDDVQLYNLSLQAAAIATQALVWLGPSGSNWDVGSTVNFDNGTGLDVFRNGDSVTFNNAGGKNVVVAQAVAPATVTIGAPTKYRFTGAGVTASSLIINGAGGAELANNGNALHNIDVRQGTLQINGAGNAAVSGVVRVAAGAALQLSGVQTFAATSQLTGEGQISGSVTMPGTVAPGDDAGLLTFANNLTLQATSTLAIELGGLVAGSQYDVLDVNSVATLNGLLSVSLINGFQPAAGASFSILTAAARNGTFAAMQLPSLLGGLVWDTSYSPTSVLLSVVPAATFSPADFNEDGFVDAEDLDAWRLGFGMATGASHGDGDANGDFAVDGTDFVLWQRGLTGPGMIEASSAAVPEPATGALVACALGVACGAVRRARRQAGARR